MSAGHFNEAQHYLIPRNSHYLHLDFANISPFELMEVKKNIGILILMLSVSFVHSVNGFKITVTNEIRKYLRVSTTHMHIIKTSQ